MTKKIIIELTEREHEALCYMLDKGWDFLVDHDYFYETDYDRKECYEVLSKVTSSK